MAWKKNADGIPQYYYKKTPKVQKSIQKDWLIEHKYKKGEFPPKFFENVEENLTPGRLGYWAYAIDGDGWISMSSGSRNGFEVGIKLKDREPIQELADIYGISISRIDYLDDNWESTYVTKISGKRALHFLRLICPYMTEKREKATRLINHFDPDYHPPKISMNFRKNPNLIEPHIGMIAGFFDTEGSVGMRVREKKQKTKKFGERIYAWLDPWINFTNTDMRPLRKIKKILETWPFNFTPVLYTFKHSKVRLNNGNPPKIYHRLIISPSQHLLFMKMFSPWIMIKRKREYADKFERKKQIYEMCKK